MLRWLTRMSSFQKNVNICWNLEADILEVLADLNHASRAGYNHLLIAQLVVQQSITHLVVATKSHQRKLPYRNCQSNMAWQQLHLSWRKIQPYVQNGLHIMALLMRSSKPQLAWLPLVQTGLRPSSGILSVWINKQSVLVTSAALGSIEAQLQLGLPSIGGKNLMSGTLKNWQYHQPWRFGVTTADSRKVLLRI